MLYSPQASHQDFPSHFSYLLIAISWFVINPRDLANWFVIAKLIRVVTNKTLLLMTLVRLNLLWVVDSKSNSNIHRNFAILTDFIVHYVSIFFAQSWAFGGILGLPVLKYFGNMLGRKKPLYNTSSDLIYTKWYFS